MIEAAPRCSRVICTMQATAARATLPSSALGQVLIDRNQEGPETPSAVQFLSDHGVLLGMRTSKEDTLCARLRLITLIDGDCVPNPKYLAQNEPIWRRLS